MSRSKSVLALSIFLAVILITAGSMPAGSAPGHGNAFGHAYVPGELLMKFNPGTGASTRPARGRSSTR